MSVDRRGHRDSSSNDKNDLKYKQYKPWETQARFLKAGNNKSRALDKLVEREKEKVRRHNRLVDLKLEEQAKARKQRRHEQEPVEAPEAPVRFGKESVGDDEYSRLMDEAKAARRQQRTEKKQQKFEQEELKAKSSKKRKRSEVLDSGDADVDGTAQEPPKKLKIDTPSSPALPTKEKTNQKEVATEQTKETTEGAGGKPARSFAEARARYEEKVRQKQEKQEAYEKRQQDIARKQEEQRKNSQKLMRRTSRGQPIMKNVIGHMLSKLEKQERQK